MKKARAPYPQAGNNLWIEVHLWVVMVLARFTGSGPPSWRCSQEQKAPWALRIAVPVAGESERRSLKLNGLRKQGGRQRALREQARAGKWMTSMPPAGSGRGAQAPGCAGLSSRHTQELATEGVRAKRIGVTIIVSAALTGRGDGCSPVRRKPIWS